MALINFSYTEQDLPTSDFELIPAGHYTAQIIKSDIKDNANGSGNRLSLTFQVLEGDKTGRLVFQDLTLQNSNPTAEQIGRQQLAQLCHAVRISHLAESTELHNIPLKVRVAIREDKTGNYPPRNEIKAFAPVDQSTSGFAKPINTPAQTQAALSGHAAASTATPGAAPWARR